MTRSNARKDVAIAAFASKRILPWRFAAFLLACASMVPLSSMCTLPVAVMLGFDFAALLFIVTLKALFASNSDAMRRHARANDANRGVVLAVTGVVTAVILVVIASELRQKSAPSLGMLVLIVATLALAWLFSNLVYMLHYAYLFYRSGEDGLDHGGLSIPRRKEPDYWDLAYFAFTLGMTFQTSDIEITSPVIRRVTLFHCLAAFIFNLGVIAFTINIIGG